MRVKRFFQRQWKWAIVVLLFSLMVGHPEQALSYPNIQVNVVHYSISGTTLNQLRQQISQQGPFDHRGQRFDATTQRELEWNYGCGSSGKGVQMTDLAVNTTITITLPQWNPPQQASASLVDRWNHYIRALQRHEEGHKQYAIAASRDVFSALKKHYNRKQCPSFNQLNPEIDQILQTYNQKDAEYDRLTRHGETQGAVF